MAKEADRLNRVVSELLELVKPAHLALQSVDLNEVITHSLHLVSQMLRAGKFNCSLRRMLRCPLFKPIPTDSRRSC